MSYKRFHRYPYMHIFITMVSRQLYVQLTAQTSISPHSRLLALPIENGPNCEVVSKYVKMIVSLNYFSRGNDFKITCIVNVGLSSSVPVPSFLLISLRKKFSVVNMLRSDLKPLRKVHEISVTDSRTRLVNLP